MALLSAREDEEDLVFSCDSDQVLSTSLRILQLVSQSFMDLSRSTTLVKEPLNPDLLTLLHRHVASFVGLIKYGTMILRPQLCRSYPPSTTTTPDKPSASSVPSCKSKSKDRSASSTFLQSMLCLAEETLLVWSQYRTHAGEDALSIVETSLLGALWWSLSQLCLFATPSSLLFSEATATLPPITIEAMRFLTCFHQSILSSAYHDDDFDAVKNEETAAAGEEMLFIERLLASQLLYAPSPSSLKSAIYPFLHHALPAIAEAHLIPALLTALTQSLTHRDSTLPLDRRHYSNKEEEYASVIVIKSSSSLPIVSDKSTTANCAPHFLHQLVHLITLQLSDN